MSDYLENSLIDHVLRTSSFSKPSTLAIALLTTAAIDADTGQFSTGTGIEVPDANAYARQTNNPSDSNWAAPSAGNGQSSNVNAITYPTATGSWGTIVASAIVDSATYDSGNMLFHGVNAAAKVINLNDVFSFPAGNLKITLA